LVETELQEKFDSTAQAHETCSRQLEESRRQHEAARLRAQELDTKVSEYEGRVEDLQAQLVGVRAQLQERENLSQREVQVWRTDFEQKAAEARAKMHEVHRLQQRLTEEEERFRRQVDESEVQAEQLRTLQQRLEEKEVKVRATLLQKEQESKRLGEELSNLRTAQAAERERLLREVKAAEEKFQASELAAKAAEAKHRQLEQDRLEAMQEREEGLQQAEMRRAAEVTELQTQLASLHAEVDARNKTFRDREASLVKSVESAAARVEVMSQELSACQAAQEESDRRLKDAKVAQSHRESEVKVRVGQLDDETAMMKVKVHDLEVERNEQAKTLRAVHDRLRSSELQNKRLKEELAVTTDRLESERIAWRRQSEEVQSEVLLVERQKFQVELQAQAEEYKRQLHRLALERKKAVQKASQSQVKLTEVKKRVTQLQSEKSTAIRLCEDNKRVYEQRISEISVIGRGQAGVEFPANWRLPSENMIGNAQRRELQELAKSLDEHAEGLEELRAGRGRHVDTRHGDTHE